MGNPLKHVEQLGEDALHAIEAFGEDIITGAKKLTKLHLPVKETSQPLKRSKTGYETEYFILNSKGALTSADSLLAQAKKRKIPAEAEATPHMVEVLCMPHHHHRSTSLHLIHNLIEMDEIAQKNDCSIYPFATYPGKSDVTLRKNPRYSTIQNVFGKEQFDRGLMSAGFHQHYTLPRGVFNQKKKQLNTLNNSKVRRTLLDSYNFLIAADPALTCFMQSSPFSQGTYKAKDTRMLFFRDGHSFDFPQSQFAKYPLLGELPPYAHTMHDLQMLLNKRYTLWKSLVHKSPHATTLLKPEKALSYYWGPLKINPIGTLEYRGMDSNLPTTLFAVSTMIKFTLRRIQQDFMLVTPTDMKLKDAFKVEGNMLFIPPESLVREKLQRTSAYDGFANKDMRMYTQRFLSFAKSEIKRFDADYLPLLKPAEKMLERKRSTSDELISAAKRAGYTRTLPQSFAQELALKQAARFSTDVHKAAAILLRATDE